MCKFIIFLILFSYSSAQNFSWPMEHNEYNELNIFTQINQIDLFTSQKIKRDISEECQAQLDRLQFKEKWVYQMADSWGKIPPGLLSGNIVEYGDFDECLSIDVVSNGVSIIGQYCARSLRVFLLTDKFKIVPVSLSVCLPDKCDPEIVIGNGAKKIKDNYIIYGTKSTFCQTKETNSELDAYDWAFIGVLIFIGVLMIICTTMDAYFRHKEIRPSHPSLLSFSVLTNGQKIFTTNQNPDQLHCLNGMRVISLMWVIAGHRYSSMVAAPITNLRDVPDWRNSLYSAYIIGARVSVDTFFFLSAFLISYSYFKNINKQPLTLKAIPMFYFHRLFRITPALAALYFLSITLIIKMSNGPIWHVFLQDSIDTCTKYWFSFFFYFQNYYNYEKMCLIPTWYLSADMQMFICAPFAVIGIGYFKKKYDKSTYAYIAATILILLTMFIPMVVEFTYDNDNEYNTHTRLSIYSVGILIGMFIVDVKNGKFLIKISYFLNIFIWGFILSAMMGCILYTWEARRNPTYLKTNLFNTFSRPVWGFGLGWVIYACITGKGGIVNWFLSQPFFQVMAKLSYSMYLLHSVFITTTLGRARTSVHFSDFETMYLWCGDFIFTILLSLLWVLAFESPMIGIEKLIFGTGQRSTQQTKKNSDDLNSVTTCPPNNGNGESSTK